MHRRYGLLILLTVLIVLAGAYSSFMAFHYGGLPFSTDIVDPHTAIIEPVAGLPLPTALHAGDQIDLFALPRATRIAISMQLNNDIHLPLGQTYTFVIRRGNARVTLPVTIVSRNAAAGDRAIEWAALGFYVLISVIALLALWRGRDRATAGLALWAITFLAGVATNTVPSDGMLGLGLLLGAWILFLLARVGFYVMAESMAGSAFSSRSRVWWRVSFLLLLGLGAIEVLGGPLVFVATGWAELLRPAYGFVLTASYLVPIALLFVSYRRAEVTHRLRLRWMLWSSVLFVAGIFLNNTPILGFPASVIMWQFMFAISMVGFLYTVLRHRVVDFKVVLNHTLVYGGVTALVLGVLAAINSLVEHAALGTSASLLLQVIVPLALGIVLGRVRSYADWIVERVFFRKKFRAENALRSFARHAGHIEDQGRLLEATVTALHTHLSVPGVAFYAQADGGYTRVRQAGERLYPERLGQDDPAVVAARADQNAVELSVLNSALGHDGYVFPMLALGELQGVLVCANRPGEHFAAAERGLITQVAHEVGAALFALHTQAAEARAQASEAQLNEVRQASEERARASEVLLNEARAREATLLETLRAFGATARS
ncbi:MAG: GAF domain-containing protein [Gammaproteobacteria bacterium]